MAKANLYVYVLYLNKLVFKNEFNQIQTYNTEIFIFIYWINISNIELIKVKHRTDVEGRRLREWRGLDTPVAWADNDECHRLAFSWTINESGSTPPQE